MNNKAKPTEAQQRASGEGARKAFSRRQVLTGGAAGLAGFALSAAGSASAPAPSSVSGTNRFTDRVVLITGATSGIGEVTAHAFSREGARVFFCGRRAQLGREVETRINADETVVQAGGEAIYMQADVRAPEQVEAFVDACVARYGRIDVAFNNAGVVFGLGDLRGNMPLAEVDTAAFDDVWATNTRGIFLALKHEVPVLLANEPWGRYGLRGVIINTASISGHGGFPDIGPYSISKHGVIGLTRCAALDYGGQGLRVLSISPGGVDTPMRRASIEAQGSDPDENPAPNIQYRTNTSQEMADVVLWLASADAPSSVQGTDIDVTMGMLTGPFAPPEPS